MAEFQETRNVVTNSFTSVMNKDVDPAFLKDGQVTHAINSQLNSINGDLQFLQNEEGNKFCLTLPYTYIGNVPLKDKKHFVCSTNDVNSEIGIFDETTCSYTKVVNDNCLGFKTSHPIRGVSSENGDCSETVYWCDNLNNNRYLNLSKIPYTYTFADDACTSKIYTTDLDCEQLNLSFNISVPCLSIQKSLKSGGLRNGAYQAAIVYSIKGQTVTDFYGVTQPENLFAHENLGEALDITLTNLDTDFPEYKLYLLVTIAQQTTVYEVGTYSTTQTKVTISTIRPTDTQVPLSDVLVQKIVYTKAEDVESVDNRLLWTSPTVDAELNYQPQVNNAILEWVAYAVPILDKVSIRSYMRDEVYALGAKILFTNGSRSAVYPFIGREGTAQETAFVNGEDAFELFVTGCDKKTQMRYWQVYNTATGFMNFNELDKCEYKIIGSGKFGYWESTEKYPDNQATFGELSCTPIRHFRFPDDSLVPRVLKNAKGETTHTIHLGVRVKNLQHPKDQNNAAIKNIQGIEIFRGDRVTEKSVIGKGLLFNMGEYEFPISASKKVPALYPNYPYNDLSTDKFLSKTQTKGENFKEKNYTPLGKFSDRYYTFHSPSFSFNKPSFGNELKIEGVQSGDVNTYFEEVYKHPKNKLITDTAFTVAVLLGLGEAYVATREKTIVTTIVENLPDIIVAANTAPNPAGVALTTAMNTYLHAVDAAKLAGTFDPTGCLETAGIKAAKEALLIAANLAAGAAGGKVTVSESKQDSVFSRIPTILRCLNGIFLFSHYFQQGVETALNAIRSFTKPEQYARQANSYCDYQNFKPTTKGTKRRHIEDANYLYPAIQEFDGVKINNYRRESAVVLKLGRKLVTPSVKDNSRQTISQANACESKKYTATASSYYSAIKQSNPSQYGQIQNVQWIDTGHCFKIENFANTYIIDQILGGDTFLNRFTIKRKFNYFNQTAFNENDGFEFDYRKYVNVPYPRYWADTETYDLSELVSLTPKLPNDKSNLDCKSAKKFIDKLKTPFVVRDQYFYLSNNGVLDFYVESEIDLKNRDWEEQPEFRHYDQDRYTDLTTLFRSDFAGTDNRYIYDKSYSKYLTENVGFTQSVYYDPAIAYTCFTKYNNRVYWSLQGSKEIVRDNKLIYLTNNYYEFPSENGNITGVKALDRTNIVFLFENSAPYLHQANDELQTDAGIKITLGDGGLFSRAPQPIISTDINYGKCPARLQLTNTQYGVLYPSHTQGRVFLLQGTKLDEISRYGMQWWFQANLPFNLLTAFPDYINIDNPIKGVGFLSTFDNTKETIYLTKTDFRIKPEWVSLVTYDATNDTYYRLSNRVKRKINFKDPLYFEDVSWTISYLPKQQGWISFHDWHPNSLLQTENHFISIINDANTKSSLWKHNERCDKYCNYYDVQYSWDLEYVENNGQKTSTFSNVEYYLESFLYDANCQTKHHLLDYNFNRAFIYNTEQITGLLKLNLATKNQLTKMLAYPVINTDSIDIEFHKAEQKFRFNQFWDICDNRAEFNQNYVSVLTLEGNGYRYAPNPAYLDYTKNIFQRKKLRHDWNKVYLSRVNADTEPMPHMKIKFSNNKQLLSPR